MITIIRLFSGLLLVILSGLPLALLLLPLKLRQNFLFLISISFAIGVGNISLVMMLISLLEINFALQNILLFLTIIVLIGFSILIYQKINFKLLEKVVKNNKDSSNRNININETLNKNNGTENVRNNINTYKNLCSETRIKKIKNNIGYFNNKKLKIKILNYKNYSEILNKQKLLKIIEIILLVLILFQVLSSIFITVIFPVRFWDAITCWSFKARAFFLDKTIYDFYSKHSYKFSHTSYPILLPLLQTYSYFSMGTLNENLMKLVFPIFYISLLIVNYGFLKIKYSEINLKVNNYSAKIKRANRVSGKNYPKTTSLFFTFIISTVPIIFDHSYIEYTNLAFAFYLYLSVMFMTLWIGFKDDRLKTNGLIILSAIFSAQLPLLRSEGILFLGFIFILFAFYLFKSKDHILKSNKYESKSLLLKEDNKINWNHKSEFDSVTGDETLPLKENNKIGKNIYKYKFLKKYHKKVAILILVLIVILIFTVPWLLLKSKLNLSILSIDWDGFENSITFYKENFINSISGLFNEFLFSKYDSTTGFFKSDYSIYWIIIFIVFILFYKEVFRKENIVILSTITFSLIIYLIGSSLIPEFLTSIERYLLHIFPLSFFLVISAISKKFKSLIESLDLNI